MHTEEVEEDLFAEPLAEPAPLATRAQVVPSKTAEEQTLERIRGIEDNMLESALSVVDGVLAFAEVQPDDEEPPEEWNGRFGEEGARRRLKLAKEGWKSAKEAAVAIKVATGVVAAITRARASEKGGPKVLNFQFVQMSAPLPEFPVLEVEADERR